MKKHLFFFILVLHLSKLIFGQHEKNSRQQFYKTEWENMKFSTEKNMLVYSDTTIDIKFYHIDIAIAVDSAYIKGNVYLKFEPVVNNLNTLKLNLHSSLLIDSITLDALSFTQLNNEILINLNTVFNTGDPVQLKIYYHGIPVLANNTKGLRYATHGSGEPVIATLSTPFLSHYWWPCKDGPGDKADSVYVDITIKDTIISGFPLLAVSNGLLDDVDSTSGITRTFKWKHRYPVVPYYVMAAISNFRMINETYTGSTSSFPLIYYVFDASYANAVTAVAQMHDAFDRFSQLFGDYPFSNEKYGMTELGFYGAIENQTNTIINSISPTWYYTFVHELAHQWFGDMITCKNWHHGWLNEGFATYSEALMAEYFTGFSGYKTFMAGAEFYNGGTVYLQSDTNPFAIFQGIIYNKGAYVLHMLRGALGDTVFFNCLQTYTSDPLYRYDHATTENFRFVCESVSGLNLHDFFDQWIYDEYYPMYKYNFLSKPVLSLTSLAVYQQQNGANGWRPVFKMPMQVKFSFNSSPDTLVTIQNDQLYQVYHFNFTDSVTSVTLDPDNWILKNAVYDPAVFVAIDEPGFNPDYLVFPNPNKGCVQLLVNGPLHSILKCEVINLLGEKVSQFLFESEEQGKIHTLDISHLQPGVYFLKISSDKKQLVKKIVKE